jgi:ribosomal-protein-alanine N-acetyltransferase
VFSIIDTDNINVGFVGLQDINYGYGSAITFIFISKPHRRKGLSIRAVGLLLDLAFQQLRLHRIATYVHASNLPSLNMVRELGFTDEGILRDACFFNGHYEDVNIVGMLSNEWQQHRDQLLNNMNQRVVLHFGSNLKKHWSWPAPDQPDV